MADAPAWLRYANQGATRNKPLSPELVQALSFLGDMGITAEVFSGGQDAIGEGNRRTGSTRHDHGGAGDFKFYKDGRMLDWANPNDQPIFAELVRRARASGITGIGAGDGYMQPGSMHIGFGPEAVWGAGGSGANAPAWLREAFGAKAATAATGQPHSPGDGHDHSGYAAAAGGGAAPAPYAQGGATQPNPDNALRQPQLNVAVAGNDVTNFLRQPMMAQQYQPLVYERRNILGGV